MTLEEVKVYAQNLKTQGLVGRDFIEALSNNGWAVDGSGGFVEVAKTPGTSGVGVGIAGGGVEGSSTFDGYQKVGFPSEGFNSMSGPDGTSTMQTLFGGVDNGNKYSGVAMPIYNAATSIFKNYVAYGGLQETKKNNAAKLAMAEEGLERQRITQGNKIAQARRYQQIGMGNSNSMAGTVATVSRNPYSTYGKYVG